MKLKTTVKNLLQDIVKNYPKLENDFEDKPITIEIKKWHKKRSPDQNALMWVILDKMAKSLNLTPDEVYCNMLKDYGVTADRPLGVEKDHPQYNEILEQFNYYVIRDGKNSKLDYVYMVFGSSTYNSEQMSVLINGILQECENMQLDVSYESAELKSLLEANNGSK